MSILVNGSTRLLVQGITGQEGLFHTQQMLDYGTNIVAGTSPGKGGQDFQGVPVYNSIEEIREEMEVNASIIFIPAAFAKDAAAMLADVHSQIERSKGVDTESSRANRPSSLLEGGV